MSVVNRHRRFVFPPRLSKRSFRYARLLTLLLLLAGNVERNPGPTGSNNTDTHVIGEDQHGVSMVGEQQLGTGLTTDVRRQQCLFRMRNTATRCVVSEGSANRVRRSQYYSERYHREGNEQREERRRRNADAVLRYKQRRRERLQQVENNTSRVSQETNVLPGNEVEMTAVPVGQTELLTTGLTDSHMQEDKKITSNRRKFYNKILEAPSYVCNACKKLCYKSVCKFVPADEVITYESIYSLETEDGCWLCNRCLAAIKKGVIPANAEANHMAVGDIPGELKNFNSLEERLISRVAAFMKLVLLPRGGQRALQGQVINFPMATSETVNQLPLPADSALT